MSFIKKASSLPETLTIALDSPTMLPDGTVLFATTLPVPGSGICEGTRWTVKASGWLLPTADNIAAIAQPDTAAAINLYAIPPAVQTVTITSTSCASSLDGIVRFNCVNTFPVWSTVNITGCANSLYNGVVVLSPGMVFSDKLLIGINGATEVEDTPESGATAASYPHNIMGAEMGAAFQASAAKTPWALSNEMLGFSDAYISGIMTAMGPTITAVGNNNPVGGMDLSDAAPFSLGIGFLWEANAVTMDQLVGLQVGLTEFSITVEKE